MMVTSTVLVVILYVKHDVYNYAFTYANSASEGSLKEGLPGCYSRRTSYSLEMVQTTSGALKEAGANGLG